MSGAPLVSVIIPAYNVERFVEEAVCSIMTQTYKNLEILVTDDCSTDGTYAILQKLASEDTRIRLFRNEQNLNIVRTLNNMIAAANGTYIVRMDADDVSLPDRIERQAAFMEANPDVSLCGTNAWHIDEAGRRRGRSSYPLVYDDIQFCLKYYCAFYHPSVMLRSGVFKANPYDGEFLCAEDYELWCRLVFTKGIKAANLAKRLVKYRMNPNGISRMNTEKQNAVSAMIFDKHQIMSTKETQFHKNIFFLHNAAVSQDEIGIFKSTVKEMSRAKKELIAAGYIKILFHLNKFQQYKLFIFAVMRPVGFYSLLRVFAERVRRK